MNPLIPPLLLAIVLLPLLRFPEICLALFLFSGTFKSLFFQMFPDLPDITVVLAVVLFAGILLNNRPAPAFQTDSLDTTPHQPAPTMTKLLIPFSIFVLIMFFSMLNNAENTFAFDKTARFALLTGLATISPVLIIKTPRQLYRFLIMPIFLALAMTLFGQVTPEGLSAFGATHIATGRIIGFGFLAILSFLLQPDTKAFSTWLQRALFLIGGVTLLYGLFYSGSRGTLIALLIAVSFTGLVGITFRRGRRLVLAGAAVTLAIVAGITLFAPDAVTTMNRRVLYTLSGPLDQTARTRVLRANAALEMFTQHPFTGVGIGGFDAEFNRFTGTRGDYPHNLFLEVAAELGILGLLFISILIINSFREVFITLTRANRRIPLIVLTVTVYSLVNALFSGDLNDNRLLFTALGLCFATRSLGVIPTPLPVDSSLSRHPTSSATENREQLLTNPQAEK